MSTHNGAVFEIDGSVQLTLSNGRTVECEADECIVIVGGAVLERMTMARPVQITGFRRVRVAGDRLAINVSHVDRCTVKGDNCELICSRVESVKYDAGDKK